MTSTDKREKTERPTSTKSIWLNSLTPFYSLTPKKKREKTGTANKLIKHLA